MLLLQTKNSRDHNAPHLLPFVVGFIIKKHKHIQTTRTITKERNKNEK
jgi:hypothetical protein